MNQSEVGNEGRFLRWIIYLLVIGASAASATYRITRVNVLDAETRKIRDLEGSPMLCANDRSRWCTVRALGDQGQYEIDEIIADPKTGEFSFEKRKYDRNWVTIDLVKHLDSQGEMHYYSSKPTLFPTLLSYIYRVIKRVTGWTLTGNTFEVVQTMLVLVNVIPMSLFLILLAATLELLSNSSFTKIILLSAASFGTFLTPFAVTLNNHLPAAVSVGIVMFCLVLVYRSPRAMLLPYLFAGLFSAFAAANELPALSFFCFAAFLFLLKGPLQTLCLFLPSAGVVIAGFFFTNYQAHQDWIPAYAHRSDGAVITTLNDDLYAEIESGTVSQALVEELNKYSDEFGFYLVENSATVHEGQMPLKSSVESRYVLTQSDDSQRLAIVKTSEGEIQVRHWNNWYEYPESRWLLPNKGGVDKGEADPAVYTFHCLVGHHGIFSLTPLWILSLVGMPLMFQRSWSRYRWISLMIIVVSLVVVAFYLTRPLEDRNYGGGTSALRWLLWLAPLWILAAVPSIDLLSRSIWGQIVVTLLLVGSIASAHYSAMNPWVHPWLYELLVKLEWIKPFG